MVTIAASCLRGPGFDPYFYQVLICMIMSLLNLIGASKITFDIKEEMLNPDFCH